MTAIMEAFINYDAQAIADGVLNEQRLGNGVYINQDVSNEPNVGSRTHCLGKLLGIIPVIKVLSLERPNENSDFDFRRTYRFPGMEGFKQDYRALREEALNRGFVRRPLFT